MSTGARVSARTEQSLRDAMGRLFTGQPRHSDGRLTKTNLATEAGVSQATMFRAKAVLADWDAHAANHGTLSADEIRRDAELNEVRRQLVDSKREITELQHQMVAAATVIAALHHDNELLRAERGPRRTITTLPSSSRAPS
jgi:heme A synthase